MIDSAQWREASGVIETWGQFSLDPHSVKVLFLTKSWFSVTFLPKLRHGNVSGRRLRTSLQPAPLITWFSGTIGPD